MVELLGKYLKGEIYVNSRFLCGGTEAGIC